MKTHWMIVAVTSVLALGSTLATHAGVRDATQDERFIRTTEASVCDAFQSGDADVLRNALDDHFTLTDSKGVVTNRDQTVANGARQDPAYLVFHNHDQCVRVYGDAAIVTGVTSMQSHTAGATSAGDYAYTDTWVHVDGRWKLAARHASLLRTR